MKKILFRKILLDCVIFFLITLFSASIIIWVFQAVNFLDIMIEDGHDYMVYINYSLLNFPKIISKLLPFAVLFSFSYVLTKYEKNNELMIFWNFGINKIQLVNFFFIFSILLMIIQIITTAIIVPTSQNLSRNFLRSSDINFYENFLKPKIFNDTIKDLTIYSEKKDKNGNLENIYIKKYHSPNKFQITYAQRGVFKNINNTQVLVLYNGETINNNENEKMSTFGFSKSDYILNNLETNTTTEKKTQENSTLSLFTCIKHLANLKNKKNYKKKISMMNCSYHNLGNIFKELNKRLILPFYTPILMLVCLLLIIESKENINYSKYRIGIFLLGILIIIFSETTLRFVKTSFLENLILMITPIILMLFLYSIFIYKFTFNLKK